MKRFLAALGALCCLNALAIDYVVAPGDDLEAVLVTAYNDYVALTYDKKVPSDITLKRGTYTLTQEMYLNWPVLLHGETGDPADVTIQGDKTFRILTINHPSAEVKDVTIAKGHFGFCNVYDWGNAGVRICKPNNLDRSNSQWHACASGAGGKLTHCIVTDCETTYYHCWGIVYLNGPKDKTLVDRCVITNNTHSGQNNSRKGTGDIVTVESGIFRNTLVARNASNNENVSDTNRTTYQGLVAVVGANAEVVGCTIVGNMTQGKDNSADARMRIGGVYAPKGKVINTVIAGNTCCNYLQSSHQAWGGTASCFVNCLTDTDAPINDTCLAEVDVGLLDIAGGNFVPMADSKALAGGSLTASSDLGSYDVAGNSRTRTVAEVETIDIGAYQYVAPAEVTARIVTTDTGGTEPYAARFVMYSDGLGSPLAYRWDLDGDGVDDLVTTTNSVAYVYTQIGKYPVTGTVTNTVSGDYRKVSLSSAVRVTLGSHDYDVFAEEGADAFQKKYDWLLTQEGATLVPQTIVLHPGTYTLTNEVMMTWPLTVRGSTGNAADVIVDLADKNKAFCLNHAKASLSSLTVYRGKTSGINSFGIVRLCAPNGRGNQTNSTGGWGNGGMVSNVVINAGNSPSKLSGAMFLLHASAGVITHCVVTNSYGWQQTDGGAMNGLFLQVDGGRADNCLIAGNSLSASNNGDPGSKVSSAVAVSGGSLVNSTVANNVASGEGVRLLCPGVHATNGKVVNTLVAGNTTGSTRAHFSTWAGTASSFVRCFMDCDEADIPNETCLAGDPRFVCPKALMWQIAAESPCRNVGTNEATWVYGATDLGGLPRTNTVDEVTTIDIGAYQHDPTKHYEAASCTLPAGAFYDGITATLSVECGGYGLTPMFYWDYDGDGVVDCVTNVTTFTQDFGIGNWALSLIISNGTENVGRSVAVANGTFEVAPHPVHYVNANSANPVVPYLTPETAANDLEEALVEIRKYYMALADDRKWPSDILVTRGTYTLTQEMYLDWPVLLRGETGNPADVTIQGNKTFRILTINHAEAEVKDVTIAKGRYYNEGGLYDWGNAGVRICKPGNLSRTNTNGWNQCAYGVGGKLTHCIVTDCHTPYFHNWGIVYLNGPKDKTLVDCCVITNNTHSGQDNGQKGKGDIVTVTSGIFRNSLVAKNRTTLEWTELTSGYQGVVTVNGANGLVLGCTIANNTISGTTRDYISGVYATAGKVVNTVIAGNSNSTPSEPYHKAWGGTASCFVDCLTDTDEPINETCLAGDPKFVWPPFGLWYPAKGSPCLNAGTNDAAWAVGYTDLAGQARTRLVGDETTLDLGAYQYDKSVVAVDPSCTLLDDLLYDIVPVSLVVGNNGFGSSPVFYWDFNGDGATDFTTTEATLNRSFGIGTWDMRVTVSNLEENVGSKTVAVAGGAFAVTPHPVHYVDINGKNPVAPYLTLANAATNIQDAIDVAGSGEEVKIMDGTYPIAWQLSVTTDRIKVGGASGKPERVIVRAVSGHNRCLYLNGTARTMVHSMTLENGRGGTGAAIKSKNFEHGAAVCMATVSQSADGDTSLVGEGYASGILSNCVVRGGYFSAKFCGSGGVFANGPNAFVTHCIITNNTSNGGNTDNGWFNAAGLSLSKGARAEHCLVSGNRGGGYFQSAVFVANGSVLRYSTVADNRCSLVGGVNISGSGRFEKCVISGNTLTRTDTSNPRHKIWGAFNFAVCETYYRYAQGQYDDLATHLANEDVRHTNEVIQTYVCTNAADIAEVDLGAGSLTVDRALLFKNPSKGNYTPRRLSPTVNRVPYAAEVSMPATDVRGFKRGCDGGYDLGAFERQNSGSVLLIR